MHLIFKYKDGTKLAFVQGKIDEWKVASFNRVGLIDPPMKDTDTFKWLLKEVSKLNSLGTQTARKAVWRKVLEVARPISKEMTLLQLSEHIKSQNFDLHWAMLAMMMYAEEKKEGSKLGRLIKLMGIWQVLFLGYPVKVAANWSRGMPWQTISQEIDRWHIREQLSTGEINGWTSQNHINQINNALPPIE